MQSIGDSYKPIRRIVAAIMGAIIKVTDPETWPEFLQILFSLLDNTELSVVDGSFITLLEITEDFSFQLTSKPLFSQFINNLLAKLIQFYSHPEPEFRNYALKILTKILLCKPDIINPYFSQFLTVIFYFILFYFYFYLYFCYLIIFLFTFFCKTMLFNNLICHY